MDADAVVPEMVEVKGVGNGEWRMGRGRGEDRTDTLCSLHTLLRKRVGGDGDMGREEMGTWGEDLDDG